MTHLKPNRLKHNRIHFKSFSRINPDTMLQHQGITSNTHPLDATDANEVAVLVGEVWKPYESAWVSSIGRFKSTLGVIVNGIKHLIHVHMESAFALPKRDDQDTVDHIDNDPSNNRLENLRWASQSEQVKHSYATNETRESNAPKRSKRVHS